MASIPHRLLLERLGTHPLYAAIATLPALRWFMEHHVYAVWDFMSLIKALQSRLAPVRIPWVPPANAYHAGFINRLVLEEESDRIPDDPAGRAYSSHFDTYCRAMTEVGADTAPVHRFMTAVQQRGLHAALGDADIPPTASRFVTFTFSVIERNEPHLIAAALAYGREELVPTLFGALISGMRIDRGDAPALHAYMERHVQLDGHIHGPIAMHMVKELCAGSRSRYAESLEIAEQSLRARLAFWDDILDSLPR